MLDGRRAAHRGSFYVHVPGPAEPRSVQRRLRLYSSAAAALAGGSEGLLVASGGKDAKLATLPEAALRFSVRIPEKQVSMAKLQGYLMKQKLEAEQHFKALKDKGELTGDLADADMDEEEHKFLYQEEVERFAAEAAVMNVHELLDVKADVEDIGTTVFDHLHRVGLHKFSPLFEHYGIRDKKDITNDLKDAMQNWDPDLKHGPQRDRLVALLEGNKSLDRAYSLADLSVLRDRFIAAFQAIAEQPDAPSPLRARPGEAPAPPSLSLSRASSGEGSTSASPPRIALLRQSSGVDAPDTKLNLLDMAHKFQEALEDNGRTDVSLWQLDMHFLRYAGDPRGALENAPRLRRLDKDRQPEERKVVWMTTFAFLLRLGLEEYAFNIEDRGMQLWVQWKHWSKDDLKDKAEMSEADAVRCHAVLSGNKDRPDLLREFQVPEFQHLQALFMERFPEASAEEARRFAVHLTDDAGMAEVSCCQVARYLKGAANSTDALKRLAEGLPNAEVAATSRVKPEPPPPPPEPTEWVHLWLTKSGLGGHSQAFLGQALAAREDVLAAPLDHKVLEGMGINKIGDRCKILKMITEEREKPKE